jgi:hypothetical protein
MKFITGKIFFIALIVLLVGCTSKPSEIVTNTTSNLESTSTVNNTVLEENGFIEDSELPTEEPLSEGSLELINSHHYVTSLGYYHITGLVKNNGTVPVKHARVLVKFYKNTGEEVTFPEVIVQPSRLAPGEIGAFDLTVGQEENFDVGNFEVMPSTFTIDNSNPYTDLEVETINVTSSKDLYTINTVTKNVGNKEAPFYWVTAIFYDSEGNVISIAVDPLVVDDRGIKPGETKESFLGAPHPSESYLIVDHDVFIDFST